MEKLYWFVGVSGVTVMIFTNGIIQFFAGGIVLSMCALRTIIEAQLERNKNTNLKE
jgi:hypothetical protein